MGFIGFRTGEDTKLSSMFDETLSDFLLYMASEKGLAENSLQAYRRDLKHFFNFARLRGITHCEALQEQDLISFLTEQHAQNYAPASVARSLAALKAFFKFLKREGYLAKNLAEFLTSPK